MDLIQPIQGKIRWTPTNSQIEIKAMDNKTADGVNVRMAILMNFIATQPTLSKTLERVRLQNARGLDLPRFIFQLMV